MIQGDEVVVILPLISADQTPKVSLNLIVSEMFSRSVRRLSGRRFDYFGALKNLLTPSHAVCYLKNIGLRHQTEGSASHRLHGAERGTHLSPQRLGCKWATGSAHRPSAGCCTAATFATFDACCGYDYVVLFKCVLKHGKQDESQRTLPIKQKVNINLKPTC